MKRLSLITLLCSIALVAIAATAKHFWHGNILSAAEVEKHWGTEPFDPTRFKSAPPEARAKMAASLLKSQKSFLGKDRTEIRATLGDYDGFYFSDMFPSYMIQIGKKPGDESWQIVFLLDNKEKVTEIIVHQNCCG